MSDQPKIQGGDVLVVELPTASLFVKDAVAVTTRKEAFTGPTPVLDRSPTQGKVAYWGANNDFPQRVVDDIRSYSLMGAVIDRKTNMLISGGLRYGKVRIDEQTGMDMLIPQRVPEITEWLRKNNVNMYLRKSVLNWYTYYNSFTEFQLNTAYDRVVGLTCHDAAHVRLGLMNSKSKIDKAFITDWRNDRAGAQAIEVRVLDPEYDMPEQLRQLNRARAIQPIRILAQDQFYYGLSPWDGLRANGWLDVAKRVPELKKLLLKNLMHIRYHIEIDERYWGMKFKGFDAFTNEKKMQVMKEEATAINDWAKGNGQGGAFISSLKGGPNEKAQESMVRITEKKMALDEGAYIEDSQEADFIICRDMGLKPSLHGISPSKSGSSPGSGSQDRVARTNHILDCKNDQDALLEPFNVVRDVNGWDPEIEFWFSNYYAATLDRTMQVDKVANAGKAA